MVSVRLSIYRIICLYPTINVFISSISPFTNQALLSYNLSSHYSIIRTQFENIKSVIKVRQIDRSITRTYLCLNHLCSEQIENRQSPDKNRRIYKQQPIRRVGIDFPIRHILHLIQPAQRSIAICYVFIKRIISVQTRSVIFIASQMHNRFGVYFRLLLCQSISKPSFVPIPSIQHATGFSWFATS